MNALEELKMEKLILIGSLILVVFFAQVTYGGCHDGCLWGYNVCSGSVFNEGAMVSAELVSNYIKNSQDIRSSDSELSAWEFGRNSFGQFQLTRIVDRKKEIIVFDSGNSKRCAASYQKCMEKCKNGK